MGYETLIDGVPEGCVAASDRGLQYGDGLFETILIRGGRPQRWSRHMARLSDGCARLGIPAPVERDLVADQQHLCSEGGDGVLKLIVTRGSGGRGYAPPAQPSPRRILSLHSMPRYPARFWEEGIALRLCRTRLSANPALAGLKHLARLDQVMARREWSDPEVPEGLMLDSQGAVIEGTMTNLFIVRDGRLLTPQLDQCGVAGVMRGQVMDTAALEGIPCAASRVDWAAIKRADEVFVCNAVVGLWPVRRLEEAVFAPGPVTRRLATRIDHG